MADAYYYSNVAVATTIGNPGGISNSATSMYAATGPSGYPGSFPFKLRLDPGTGSEEVVKVTAGAGTSGSPWTIVRGWDGTTAVTHSGSGVIAHGMTAEDLKLSRDHEATGNPGSGTGPHGLPASAWISPSFGVIAETTLSAASGTVTFSSIPNTFAHLLVVFNGKSNDTTSFQETGVSFVINGDTGSYYSTATISAYDVGGGMVTGVGSSDGENWAQNAGDLGIIAGSKIGGGANSGGGWALFQNYAGTTFNKNHVSLSGYGLGTARQFTGPLIVMGAYNPPSQVAITSLTFTPAAGSFMTGTFFGLYGFGA